MRQTQSEMSSNKKWRRQFHLWRSGESSDRNIKRILRRYRKFEIDLEVIQESLIKLHRNIDTHLLDPKLLPAELLLYPEQWNPTSHGIHILACLNHHRHISNIDELLPSGTLNQILNGELSLYGDLPPIPIRAYQEGLNTQQRKFCRANELSSLEHLATEGWQAFRICRPVAVGFDRYHPEKNQQSLASQPRQTKALLVLGGDPLDAQHIAIKGGWDEVISCPLKNTQSLPAKFNNVSSEHITICHSEDIPAIGAASEIFEALKDKSSKALLTCDDIITHKKYTNSEGYEHRQYRCAVTPWRLFTRSAMGGLLTVPVEILRNFSAQNSYTCIEAFRLDLLLASNIDRLTTHHLSQPLVRSPIKYNPILPEQGWPAERHPFNDKQLTEIMTIRQRHAEHHLLPGGNIYRNPLQPGSHDITYTPECHTLISILIPFRDQMQLTRSCVTSIQNNAGPTISYEIVLIDNGSTEIDTKKWIETITCIKNISCIRIDSPFNFARLNNKARQACKGSYLLFLNNDVEFKSKDILQNLLNPFAYPSTSAVGAKLNYPDKSIQHQGVVIITGERRPVQEPGKHLHQPEIIESLLPLRTQEEFSAASAACLMVRAESFDDIGGFDEDLAVIFNDVDLCLRLREAGGRIVVTPHLEIIHHESIRRGKDLHGEAWIRHQRESGLLRHKHQLLYRQGDSLTSPLLHHHSNRYEPAPLEERSIGPAREQILYTWNRSQRRENERIPLIFAQFDDNQKKPIRADILSLLQQYRRHFHVQVVAATPALLQHPRDLRALEKVCDGLIVRRNEGYDYGSWMTGIRFCRELIEQRQQLVLCNDSFWGPVRPLSGLIEKLQNCTADVIGLTDNLMYEPHLQSPFLMFNQRVISCPKFWTFWNGIQCWGSKRSIVKNYEVGLPAMLRREGFQLESLYSTNANGNILHSGWKSLIEEQNFPFIKASLLKDNPRQIDISDWKSVVHSGNKKLAREIEKQLKSHALKELHRE